MSKKQNLKLNCELNGYTACLDNGLNDRQMAVAMSECHPRKLCSLRYSEGKELAQHVKRTYRLDGHVRRKAVKKMRVAPE